MEKKDRRQLVAMELNMTYIGKVVNGTVILPRDAHLPEGTTVRVEPIAPETLAAPAAGHTGAMDISGKLHSAPDRRGCEFPARDSASPGGLAFFPPGK